MKINYLHRKPLNEWEDFDDMNINTMDKTLDHSDDNKLRDNLFKDIEDDIFNAVMSVVENIDFLLRITDDIVFDYVLDPNKLNNRSIHSAGNPKCLLGNIEINKNKILCDLNYYIPVSTDEVNIEKRLSEATNEFTPIPQLSVMMNLLADTDSNTTVDDIIQNIFLDTLRPSNFNFSNNIKEFLKTMKIEIRKTQFMYYVLDGKELNLADQYANAKMIPIENLVIMHMTIPTNAPSSRKNLFFYNPKIISNHLNRIFKFLKVDINDYKKIFFMAKVAIFYELYDKEYDYLYDLLQTALENNEELGDIDTGRKGIEVLRNANRFNRTLSNIMDNLSNESDKVTGVLKYKYAIHEIIDNKITFDNVIFKLPELYYSGLKEFDVPLLFTQLPIGDVTKLDDNSTEIIGLLPPKKDRSDYYIDISDTLNKCNDMSLIDTKDYKVFIDAVKGNRLDK